MPTRILIAVIIFLLGMFRLSAAERLFVDDPKILTALERKGFGLSEILLNSCSENTTTSGLTRSPQYQNLVARLGLDFELQRQQVLNTIPPKNQGKIDIFPKQWLMSPQTRFELVGLISRPDRSIEAPTTCGEFRLVYRLRYDIEMKSRLPMTLMLEYDLPAAAAGETCAKTWADYAEVFAAMKAQGTLPSQIPFPSLAHFDRLKVNIQVSHVPRFRNYNKIMQGQYLLRSFTRSPNGYFEPEALENSIDIAAIQAEANLKNDLLQWLLDPVNLAKVDQGNYLLPAKFLSRKAYSVVPFGMQRKANQTLSQVFSESDFAGVDFSPYKQIQSPESLLRRLDSFSCQGCHVSRSVAGFHFMGAAETLGFNTILTPYSNHFYEVQDWRESFLNPLPQKDRSVPPPEHSHKTPGITGQHCGVPDAPGFKAWTCASGFACYPSFPSIPSKQIGICLPDVLLGTTGQVCDAAKFVSKGDPVDDELTDNFITSCGVKGVCAQSQHGFPNGKCTHSCKYASDHPDTLCVPTPRLTHFSPCLATGKSFKACIDESSSPVLLATCDRHKECNDDFVCAGVAGQSMGVCLPSYTQPQLLLRPHPAL